MKDMLDATLSAYSGVDWSAPDDATIEGEFPLAPLSLRYTKGKRRLHLRLTEISALEIWGQPSRGGADAPAQELTARGELAEVLTVFELDGGPVRQFREVRKVMIVPEAGSAEPAARPAEKMKPTENDRPEGALSIQFEGLSIHGEHPEPALNLNIPLDSAEFQRVYSLIRERAEEIKEVTLILDAELFGDEVEPDDDWSGWTPEYGILRPSDTPLVYAPARLDQMDVVLARTRVMGGGASKLSRCDQLRTRGQADDGTALIAGRLGWIVALLVVIALILLTGEGRIEGVKRNPPQIAENTRSLTLEAVERLRVTTVRASV